MAEKTPAIAWACLAVNGKTSIPAEPAVAEGLSRKEGV
jgi:hypothetical protein|tara:strand:- start:29213 stop:29326 length:114 start_codon:yes stop_codon:yes gene_type:complete